MEKKKKADTGNEETQADALIRLGSEMKLFRNVQGDAFAKAVVDGREENILLRSRKFELLLTRLYYEETGRPPAQDAIRQARSVLEMRALFDGEEHKLHQRVAAAEGAFYYDLANSATQVVEMTAEEVQVLTDVPVRFVRNRNTKAQVDPDYEGDVLRILEHVPVATEDDQILLAVYIVTCLVPGIPHPVLVLHGEKGAAKSTTLRMVKAIVDPAHRDIQAMPNSIADLALALANAYFPCFDNLDRLSPEKSDLLCQAVTGGGFSKRTLYSDSEETILSFLRCIGLNGIIQMVQRSDLLDRSLLLELQRIDMTERKEERQVWEDFERDLPGIVGGALMTLAGAMGVYPTVTLEKMGRMADFERWGYAVAHQLGIGGDRFLEAYRANQGRSNDEAVASHPVASAVVALMDRREAWSGPVAELLTVLEEIAKQERINTKVSVWPKAAHVLSKRLREMRSNLEQKGIVFEIRAAGACKEISLTRTDWPEDTESEEETQEED